MLAMQQQLTTSQHFATGRRVETPERVGCDEKVGSGYSGGGVSGWCGGSTHRGGGGRAYATASRCRNAGRLTVPTHFVLICASLAVSLGATFVSDVAKFRRRHGGSDRAWERGLPGHKEGAQELVGVSGGGVPTFEQRKGELKA
jgi:hypothetical protein